MKKALFLFFIGCFISLNSLSQSSNCYDDLLPRRYLKNGKMGFQDLFGNWIIRPKYFEVFPFDGGFAKVRYGNHYGMVNCEGEEVVPPEYDELGFFSYGRIWARKNKSWYLRDSSGNLLTENPYDEYQRSSIWHSYSWVKKGEKWKMLNEKDGGLICDKEFSIKKILSDTLSLVSNNSYYGIINHKNCKFKIPESIVSAAKVSSDHLKIRYKNGKYDILNPKGESILNEAYNEILSAGNGIARAKSGNKWGLIKPSGEELLSFEYDSIGVFRYKRIAVQKGQKWFYLNEKLKRLNEETYDNLSDFSKYGALAMKNDKWALIDHSGKEKFSDLDSIEYHSGIFLGLKDGLWRELKKNDSSETFLIVNFSDSPNNTRVNQKDEWGVYDFKSDRWKISPQYSDMQIIASGMYVIENTGKYGLIDSTGKVVIPTKYEMLEWQPGFRKSLWIASNGTYQLIDRSENVILESNFPIRRQKNLFILKDEKNIYLHESDGDLIFEEKADSVIVLDGSNSFLYRKKGKWGMMDVKGKELFDSDFSRLQILNEKFIALKEDDYWLIANEKGKILISPEKQIEKIEEVLDDSFILSTATGIHWMNKNSKILEKNISQYQIAENGKILIKKNESWYVKNPDGSDFSDLKFNDIEIKNSGTVLSRSGVSYELDNNRLRLYLPLDPGN